MIDFGLILRFIYRFLALASFIQPTISLVNPYYLLRLFMFEPGFVSIVSNTKYEHVGCLVIWVLNLDHIKDMLHMF
jgi:hypothetical protein